MFDLIFVVIICLLSLLGFIKGFVKSFFSVLTWILALATSYFLAPFVTALLPAQYSPMIMHSVAGTVIFTVSLIVFSMFTSSMSKTFLSVFPDPVDKSLGFAFGFTKAYVIVSILFAVVIALYSTSAVPIPGKTTTPDGKVGPTWLVEAKSYKILELGANIWKPFIEKIISSVKIPGMDGVDGDVTQKIKDRAQEEIGKKLEDAGGERFKEMKRINDLYKNLDNIDGQIQKGYHKKEIEKMDRLIETIE